MSAICGYGDTHQSRHQMGGCGLITTVVVLAGLALAAYGAFVLSQRNPYTYSQGISFVSGGLATAVVISLLASCCCSGSSRTGRRMPLNRSKYTGGSQPIRDYRFRSGNSVFNEGNGDGQAMPRAYGPKGAVPMVPFAQSSWTPGPPNANGGGQAMAAFPPGIPASLPNQQIGGGQGMPPFQPRIQHFLPSQQIGGGQGMPLRPPTAFRNGFQRVDQRAGVMTATAPIHRDEPPPPYHYKPPVVPSAPPLLQQFTKDRST